MTDTDTRPMLVLVGGAPGSGRTVIARPLKDACPRLVLMERDEITEVLVDTDAAPTTPLSGLATPRLAIHQAVQVLQAPDSEQIATRTLHAAAGRARTPR